MAKGFRQSGHGGPPPPPCRGAAWNHVTMHRVHARCMHRVTHGAFAGAQHMQHRGVRPAKISLTSSKPLWRTTAYRSKFATSAGSDAPSRAAADNARAYGSNALRSRRRRDACDVTASNA